MLIFFDIEGCLRREGEVTPSALEALTCLLTYREIKLSPLFSDSTDLAWMETHFPQIPLSSAINSLPLDAESSDVLITTKIINRSQLKGRFIHFDIRNPRSSWKKALQEIKGLLNNSRELSLYSVGLGPVVLINNTRVMIKELKLNSFSYEFVSEGSVHRAGEGRIFRNIQPGESITVKEHALFKHEGVFINYCQWADGERIEEVTLEAES
jgi:hypothetical protein